MINRKLISSIINNTPAEIIAAAGKVEKDRNNTLTYNNKGELEIEARQSQAFMTYLKMRADKTRNNEDVVNILKDLALAANVYTSCLVFPENLKDGELNFSINAKEIHPDLAAACSKALKTKFKRYMDLEPKVFDIAYEALFKSGAVPYAILPENALDALINGAARTKKVNMESFSQSIAAFIDTKKNVFKPLGILGANPGSSKPEVKPSYAPENRMLHTDFLTKRTNTEVIEPRLTYEGFSKDGSDFVDEYITITDNPNVLRLPKLNEIVQAQKMRQCLSTENMYDLSDKELLEKLTANKNNESKNGFSEIKAQSQLSRQSIGNSVVLKFASEAVMPIHSPGNPDDHVAYLVLIDEHGHPISRYTSSLLMMSYNPSNLNTSLMSNMSSRAGKIMGGPNDMNNIDVMSDLYHRECLNVYSEVATRDFLTRLRNGVHGNAVEIESNDAFIALMLSRSLTRQRTRVLYIPKEYMIYFACQYDQRGIGKSLFDDAGVINSTRSTALAANAIGGIKDAMGLTVVECEISDDDPDGRKTESIVRDLILKGRNIQLPSNGGDWDSIISFLNNASVRVHMKSNKDTAMTISTSQETQSHPQVSTETMEELKKQSLASVNMTIEQIDKANSGDLAIQEVHSNEQLMRATHKNRAIFNKHLTKFHLTYLEFSPMFRREIISLLKANVGKITIKDETLKKIYGKELTKEKINEYKVRYAFKAVLRELAVKLPEPADSTLKDIATELDDYIEANKKFIEYKINNQLFDDDTGASLGAKSEFFVALAVSNLASEFLAKRGVMLDLNSLFAKSNKTNEGGTKLANSHIEMMSELTKLYADINAVANANKTDLKNKGIEIGEGGGSSFGDSGSDYENDENSDDDEDGLGSLEDDDNDADGGEFKF